MIDLYTWTTPNGRKISILLEELGLPYTAHAVNIGKDEQFAPDFLKISPNNKIPAIVDHDTGVSQFESGAIMIYLAEKAGKFLPTDTKARAEVMQWLMWQMGGFGPMLGQAHVFLKFNRGLSQPAEDRFGKEAQRLYGVLARQLADHEYVAGDYSIADMAIYPWAKLWKMQQQKLEDFPNMAAWLERIDARPAVQRAYALVEQVNADPQALLTAEARRLLFGQ